MPISDIQFHKDLFEFKKPKSGIYIIEIGISNAYKGGTSNANNLASNFYEMHPSLGQVDFELRTVFFSEATTNFTAD